MEIVRIPQVRVGILVGENGKTKKRIEERAKIKLEVKSDGEVSIDGKEEDIYFAKDIIKAIGRGFSPRVALKLLRDDKAFLLINLKEFFNTPNGIRRIKARIIGEEGRVKKEIENSTDCDLAIYGTTVGVIGAFDSIEYSREAVMKIINGSRHSTVFNYLTQAKRKIFQERLK